MTVDTSAWSGEGEFTSFLVEALKTLGGIDLIRVEDAPASRAGQGYNLLSNEIYVRFAPRSRTTRARVWGVLPVMRTTREPRRSLAELAAALAAVRGVGLADYADEGMLQYLRTERIIPPYQTRGVKLVELVRIYEAAPDGSQRPPNG